MHVTSAFGYGNLAFFMHVYILCTCTLHSNYVFKSCWTSLTKTFIMIFSEVDGLLVLVNNVDSRAREGSGCSPN